MPQRPPLIADIRFTSAQVERARLAGVDTSTWQVNDDVVRNVPVGGSRVFADNWPNPSSYPG